jgi:hypothetical protein
LTPKKSLVTFLLSTGAGLLVDIKPNKKQRRGSTRTRIEKMNKLQQLDKHETVIKNGLKHFLAVGEALYHIRNEQLYKLKEYKTFEIYCNEQWGITRQYASQLILAFRLEEDLSTTVDKTKSTVESVNISTRFNRLPKDEQNRITNAVKIHGHNLDDEVKRSEQILSGNTPSIPHWDKFVRAINTIQKVLEKVGNDEHFVNRLKDIIQIYNETKTLPVVSDETEVETTAVPFEKTPVVEQYLAA